MNNVTSPKHADSPYKKKASRNNSGTVASRNVSAVHRFVHKIQKRYSILPVLLLVFSCIIEVASITLYVLTEEARIGSALDEFFINRPVFICQVCFSLYFVIEWLIMFLLEEFKLQFFFSFVTLVNAVTCVPMVIVGIVALADDTWMMGWIPMFLRVWWLHRHLLALLDYPELTSFVNDLHREIVRFTIGLLATMLTCVGVFQAAETYSGGDIHFFESLYFTVVTFGTIGYGDYFPTTTISRIVVVVIIIVAIYTFPLFFSSLAELAQQRSKYTFYSSSQGRNLHVIIIGSLSDRDVSFFLNEFFSGSRRYINLNIVLLSDVPFSQATRLLVSAPNYKDRVTLVIGDCLRSSDLERCDASFADAAFLVSSRDRSSFSDYSIVQRALAVRQFDGNLPLHVMLKRERNTKFVAPIAKTVMEKERLKFTLLGMATVLPGSIPLIVNLVRTYDPPEEVRECKTWMQQNEWSMGQELYTVLVPPSVKGRRFVEAAFALGKDGVALVGVVDHLGVVTLNPQGTISQNVVKLVVLAEDFSVAARAVKSLGDSTSLTAVTVMPPSSDSARRDKERVVAPPSSLLPSVSDKRDAALITIENGFNLQDHFVLIDLSSAQAKPTLSPEAAEEAAHFRATDLLNVIRPIKEMFPEKEVLLLARDEPNAYFTKLWKRIYRHPILLLKGCGLSFHDVAKCNVQSASGVVVFSSEERCDTNADAMTLLTTLSVEEILGRNNAGAPIVAEIDQIESLPLFPPFYSQDAMSAKAEDNWAFEPNFVVGNSVCSTMLDPALYQSYFNPELLKIVDALTFGGLAYGGARISRMRLSEFDLPSHERFGTNATSGDLCLSYQQVQKICFQQGLAPIGLHRLIRDEDNEALDGRRFMLTNPPPSLPVSVTDDIVYFLTPGHYEDSAVALAAAAERSRERVVAFR